MHYRLNDMVFLVDGRSRSCIYDLEQKKLYSIGKEESDEIKKAINSDGYNNFDNKLINKIEVLDRTENYLKRNLNINLLIDKMIIDMCGDINETS